MVGKNGYFDLTSGFFTVRTYWSETYEVSTNASIVQIDSVHIKTSYLGTEYPSGYIKVNGANVVTFDAGAGTHSFYVGTANTWASVGGKPAAPWKSGSIAHGADGKKSIAIEVSISGTGMGSGWSVSGSKTVALTDIPRASTPSLSAANPYAGDTVTVYTNRKVSSYTHDITYTFGTASGTIGTNVGASTQWAIPISLAKAITGTSGTLKIRTVTKSGSTTLGTVDVEVTLRIPDNDTTKPIISSVTLAEVSGPFSGVYVQGRSAIKVTTAASSNYSSIAKYQVTVLGKTYTGSSITTAVLDITGSVSVKVTVTDARGFSRSTTKSVVFYPYASPSVAPASGQSSVICKRCTADGTVSVSGTYLKIVAARKYSSVNGNNKCILRYRWKSSGNWSSWVTLLSRTAASNEVSTVIPNVVSSTVTSYTIEIGVLDDVGTSKSVKYSIGTAGAVWHAAEGGEALGIGGYAQRKGVDVFWPMHMNGNRISGFIDMGQYTGSVNTIGDGGLQINSVVWITPNTLDLPYSGAGVYGFCETWAASSGIIMQRLTYFRGMSCSRMYFNAQWYEWYWTNPPMVLGEEYLTVDRLNGQQVYTQLIEFGALPNNTVKKLEHGIANISSVVDYSLFAYSGGSSNLVGHGNVTSILATATYIQVATNYNLSGVKARAVLRYTKTS